MYQKKEKKIKKNVNNRCFDLTSESLTLTRRLHQGIQSNNSIPERAKKRRAR